MILRNTPTSLALVVTWKWVQSGPAASLGGALFPEFHRGSEGLLETSRVMICNSSSGFFPPGGGCGCQRMQDQEHHTGPAFHFVVIKKIIKFRQCLLLLALGIISGAPPLPPWLFPHGSPKCFGTQKAPADVGRSCSSGGVNGWPCCRTQGGDQSLHAWTYSAVFSGIRHSIMSQPRGNTRNESRQVI